VQVPNENVGQGNSGVIFLQLIKKLYYILEKGSNKDNRSIEKIHKHY